MAKKRIQRKYDRILNKDDRAMGHKMNKELKESIQMQKTNPAKFDSIYNATFYPNGRLRNPEIIQVKKKK